MAFFVQKGQVHNLNVEKNIFRVIVPYFGKFVVPKKDFSGRKICFSAICFPDSGILHSFFGSHLAILSEIRQFVLPKNKWISASISFFGMFFGVFGGRP